MFRKRRSLRSNLLLIGKTGTLLLRKLHLHLLLSGILEDAVPTLGFHDCFSVVGICP